jgi:hypothetical protein
LNLDRKEKAQGQFDIPIPKNKMISELYFRMAHKQYS